MKILVTGGAGFLGSHLCDLLVNDISNQVICLDNLSTGRIDNIKHLLESTNFEFVEQDIEELDHYDVDEIYNLACPASPPQYQKNPVKTINTCVIGSKNVLELAVKNNAKILQASTSEIYGDPLEHPQKEEYFGNCNTFGARSCYDEGKRCAEAMFYSYMKQHQVDIRIVRLFNTYGPRMDSNDGRVVSNFIMQCLTGEDLTVYGDGSTTRSFCYVSDTVKGIYMLMQSKTNTPVNIGNPKENTLIELADKIKTLCGVDNNIKYLGYPEDDPKKRNPNIDKAYKEIGWTPTVSLDDGLTKTINWFKENYAN